MDALTEDDLDALRTPRPNLMERAKEATRQRKLAEKTARDERYEALCEEAVYLMREILLMTEGEMATVEFNRTAMAKDEPKVEFSVEGWRFHVHYEDKVVHNMSLGDGSKHAIHDDVPVYQFRAPQATSFSKFETLADLGERFGVSV